MAIFKQDMVEILMNAGCLHRLDSPSLFVTCNGGELGLMWKDAEATIEQFYDFFHIFNADVVYDCDHQREAYFFVMANYLTYIPYGSCGYAAFKQMLKEVNPELSVGKFRYEWFKKCVGKPLLELNTGQLEYIQYFFENYEQNSVNYKIPADLAKLVCRFHHECEANFGHYNFINQMDIGNMTDEFSENLVTRHQQSASLDVDLFLRQVPSYDNLGKEELDFIRKFIGLSEG